MSRLYEALQKFTPVDNSPALLPATAPARPAGTAAAAAKFGLPGLDEAPTLNIPVHPENRLVTLWDESSAGAEKIRILAVRLRQIQQRCGLKKILITSSVKNEGKSVVAANLAITLAHRGSQRVLLVDGDSRQRTLDAIFGVNDAPGLVDAWQQQSSTIRVLWRCDQFPMWVLPAGEALEQPLEMLQSRWLPQTMSELNGCFDWIVIDSPPLAPVVDSSVWATLCDGVLLVARAGKTPTKVLSKVAGAIEKRKLLGVILNDCADNRADYNYYENYNKVSIGN